MVLLLYYCPLFEFGFCHWYSFFIIAPCLNWQHCLLMDIPSHPPPIVQSLIDQDLHTILLFKMTPSQNLKSSMFAQSINIVNIFSFAFILTLIFHNQTKQPLFDCIIIKLALMIESISDIPMAIRHQTSLRPSSERPPFFYIIATVFII